MCEISVIITTYNKMDLLMQTIQSVLGQTLPIRNVTVLDNCSTDGTEDRVKDITGIKYIKNDSNIGMINNWNKCFQLCKTKYLCILHDDDILDIKWHKEWGKILIPENNDCAFYFSAAGMINNRGRLLSESRLYKNQKYLPGDIYNDLVKARIFSFPVSGTVIYNLNVLSKVNKHFLPWDKKINTYPDIEFHDRISSTYPVFYFDELLFYSRQEYSPNRSETLKAGTTKEYYKSYISAILPFLIRMYRKKKFPKQSLNKLWLHYYFLSVSFAVIYREKSFISNIFEIKKNWNLQISYSGAPAIWIRDIFKYLSLQVFRKYVRVSQNN